MNGNGFVKLRIAGVNLNLEEITEKLSQQPSFICRKGDVYTPELEIERPVVYEEDCWQIDAQKEEGESFDAFINKFLSGFRNARDYLKELSDNFDVTLWISAYPHDVQSNIHLTSKTIKQIADLGLSLDFTSMFLKEFYDGTYEE